jgi:hypothetical protein
MTSPFQPDVARDLPTANESLKPTAPGLVEARQSKHPLAHEISALKGMTTKPDYFSQRLVAPVLLGFAHLDSKSPFDQLMTHAKILNK